jgi:hypothetical protein
MASKKSKKNSKPTVTANRKQPRLCAALLCENVLQDKDGVLSLIRVIDTFNINATTKQLPPGFATFKLHVSFKADEAIGPRTLLVVGRSPDRKEILRQEYPIQFTSDADGANGAGIIADCQILIGVAGTYWFEVFLNSEFVTRIPLRIVYQQTAQ